MDLLLPSSQPPGGGGQGNDLPSVSDEDTKGQRLVEKSALNPCALIQIPCPLCRLVPTDCWVRGGISNVGVLPSGAGGALLSKSPTVA